MTRQEQVTLTAGAAIIVAVAVLGGHEDVVRSEPLYEHVER